MKTMKNNAKLNSLNKHFEWAIQYFALHSSIHKIASGTNHGEEVIATWLLRMMWHKRIMKKVREIEQGILRRKSGNYETREIMAW